MHSQDRTHSGTEAGTAIGGADAEWGRLVEAELAGWDDAEVSFIDWYAARHEDGDFDDGGCWVFDPVRSWADPTELPTDFPGGPFADAAPTGGSAPTASASECDPLSGGSDGFWVAGMAPGVTLAALLDAYTPAHLGVRDVADSVAAWERIIAWATARQAEAAAELTHRAELRPDDGNGRFGALHPVPVAAGVLCAVRPWTKPQAEKLVDHAVTLIEHYPAVHQALLQGRLDAAKARILTRALGKCDTDVAALIEKAVLPFVHGWTDVKLSRVVNELLHELDAVGAKRRRREARNNRDVRVESADEGMAWLIAYLPAEGATAILAALNAAADAEAGRRCEHSIICACRTDRHDHDDDPDEGDREGGDVTDLSGKGSGGASGESGGGHAGRNHGQDGAGQDGATGRGGGAGRAGPGGCAARTRAQRRADALASLGWSSLTTGHLGGRERGSCGAAAGTRLATTHGRPVTVNVTLPMATLLGLNEHPGYLDGYGPIDADTARTLAAAGFWRWVGTAPAGGHAIDYGTTRYSPPQDLVDFVLLRDRECLAPGCHRPAERCEIDHRTPWPYGPTSACNCSALCKPCHVQKHHAGWRVEHIGGGRQRWTSPTGHTSVVQIPRISPDARNGVPPGGVPGLGGADALSAGADHDLSGEKSPPEPDMPPF